MSSIMQSNNPAIRRSPSSGHRNVLIGIFFVCTAGALLASYARANLTPVTFNVNDNRDTVAVNAASDGALWVNCARRGGGSTFVSIEAESSIQSDVGGIVPFAASRG